MNILVTGCNGQLGTEVRNLAATHSRHHYIFTDYQELDICDEQAVEAAVEQTQADCIVNCAAFTAVDKAESEEAAARRLNADAPGYLARAIDRRGGTMIQISTDYVFDGTAHVPYREDDAPCPQSAYGRTKLLGEKAVLEGCRRAAVVRTAWLYSPYGNNFVKTMLRLGREKQELGVVFDQIGTPTCAHDLAAAVFAMVEQGVEPGIYHFTNEGVISWYDFTKAIHRIAGIGSCKVRPIHTADYPTPAARPHYSVLDKTKIKATYHIDIPYWEESLEACIRRMEEAR
jgi:dTDP-4-dehydrorhamnose reductase